ncbi:LysR family transcriptional regulator substrate-binding protein, partial [Brucella grignonensis]|uniref:LysR family transcriptional regulator substrate-binding protein n=1 Tax=Brucella grignonensis TaxID=94627 RepID=UPI00113FE799
TDAVASTRLFEDEMSLICSTEHAFPDEIDLTATRPRFVAFPAHYALGKMLQSSGIRAEIAAETETVYAMLRLVAVGVGVCVLPERIPDRLIADLGCRKVRIVRPRMRRLVVAIMRNDKATVPLSRDLIRAAQAHLE